MNVSEIISNLKSTVGNNFDVSKVTEALKSFDYSKLSMPEITAKLTSMGVLGGKGGNVVDGLKSKASGLFGSVKNIFKK